MTPRARIAVGIILVVLAPVVWFLLVLAPVRRFELLPYIVAGGLLIYGIFLIVLGRAEKRREAEGTS